jgi:hypothetical protein
MKDLELELKTLQFKYELLKKTQAGTPEYIEKELELIKRELKLWKDYAYKLKPREDKMREYIQYLSKNNEELEEKLSKLS